MASLLIDVYVKLPTGRTSSLSLLPTEKVLKICEHIGKEEGVPGALVRLKYQGKMLDKTKTIGYLGVRPETILKGEIIALKPITVYVKFKDGVCEGITLKNSDTLLNLKKWIYEKSDIPTEKQRIKFSGRMITNNNLALYEHGIGEESVLEVEESDTPVNNSISTNEFSAVPSEELKENVLTSFDNNGKQVEVAFCFDTTGSMSSYLNTVRTNLKDTCQRLMRDIPNIRIGIMAHGDYCDYSNYVVRYVDLTSDVDQLVDFAESTPSTSGGDTPECYEWALRKAQHLDWSEDSAKALVMIGDCEPHEPSYTDQNVYWRTELDILKGMGVKVYGVFCARSSGGNAEAFYEEISDHTGGCLLRLAYFNLITEMFLGVCYREAAPEQLDAFTEELKKDGKLTGDTKTLMEQLDQTPNDKKEQKATKPSTRTIKEGWWDPQRYDLNKTHQYEYLTDEDRWKPRSHSSFSSEKSPAMTLTGTGNHTIIDAKPGQKNTKRMSTKTKCSLRCPTM